MKKIEKREKKVYHPYDLSFAVSFDEFPKEFTEVLNIPGEFKKSLSLRAHKDTSEYEMDAPYIAAMKEDGDENDVAVVVEHLSTPLTPSKSIRIGDYVDSIHLRTGLPVHPVVVSKHPITISKYKNIGGRLYVNLLENFMDEEKIEEILNSIRDKHIPNEVLSINQGMELVTVVLFPPDDRKTEILLEAIDHYCNSTIEHPRLRFVLYTVFYSMIDTYVDDKYEFKRLIKMINDKATPEERQESKLLTHMRESLANLTSKIETLTTEKETLADENESFSRGIQDLLDTDADVSADYIKSELRKLLSRNSTNSK